MTATAGLVRIITDALTIAPPPESYTPCRITEHDWQQIEALKENSDEKYRRTHSYAMPTMTKKKSNR